MFALKPGFHIAIRCRKVPAELACNVGNGMLNCMAKLFKLPVPLVRAYSGLISTDPYICVYGEKNF